MMYREQILDWNGPERMADGKESVNHYHHRHALRRRYTAQHGRALRALLEGWAMYADAHQDQCEAPVTDDGVLGEHWLAIGHALRRLLDGECGGWDAGSLNANISRVLWSHGINPDMMEPVAH